MRLGLGIGLQFGHRSGGAAQGPSNTVAPAVTGTAERGELLTCSTGTWTGTGSITYAYQWRRNGSPIAGATNNTYTLVEADDNANISCLVSATDDEGSRSASSNTVGPVLGAPFLLTAPVLSGTEAVGQTLSVTAGTWQGVAMIRFAYQWRRDGVDIPGATGSNYTLVAADYDAVIDCVVTATNSLDSASADSNDTGAIAGLAPTNDTAPSIAGNTGLGDTLTRTAGSWSGVPTPSIAGQWRRNGVAISGETGATYTIVAADSGADIDYLETATNAEGSATADSNDITVQTFAAPVNTVAPSITGNDPAGFGDILTRVQGTWTGNPTPVLSGEWYRNNVATGETGTTYTITTADDDSFIFYRETATNAIGSTSEDSAAVTVEDFTVPVITGSPTIAGTEEVDETLTATPAAATGNPSPVRTWQWQRSADGSTGWADISGATSSTYVLDAADENNYVRVKQIETNALGSDEAVSAATGQIQAGGATGILDSYTGAAFAFAPDVLIYGAHSVTDNAAGSATNGQTDAFTVRVRRSSDNAVSSFTYTEVSDGTLTTWVGAGNDGFVEAGFDQGTNGNHATQSTSTNQPKIVNNGSLVVENGKAAMDFDGSNDYFFLSPQFNCSVFTTFIVYDANNTNQRIMCSRGTGFIPGNVGAAIRTQGAFSSFIDDGSSGACILNNLRRSGRMLLSVSATRLAGNITLSETINAGTPLTTSSPEFNFATTKATAIGSTFDGSTQYLLGTIQIIVHYQIDNTTNQSTIETAINNEYNIY